MNDRQELRKAELALGKEQIKQIKILYSACAIVWWQEYGWRETRILRRFETSNKVWDECGQHGIQKSIFEMLEEEAGVNLQLTGCDDWHNLPYFSFDQWDGNGLTVHQYTYMRWEQKKWIAPMILACICVSLYRDEHWGAQRLSKFIYYVDLLRQQFGERPDLYIEELYNITGIKINKIEEVL